MAKNRGKKSAKKEMSILLGAVALGIAIFAVVVLMTDKTNEFKEVSKQLTVEEVNQKIANGDDFVLLYSATNCPACKAYKPILTEVMKETEGVDLYHIEIDTLSDSDRAEISAYLSAEYTPSLYSFIDGNLQYSKLVGKQTKSATVEFLNAYLESKGE